MSFFVVSLLAIFGIYLVRRGRRERPMVGEVELLAHRGGWEYGGGNSREAIEASVESGTRLVELDVQRTRTGVFVLRHDRHIKSGRWKRGRKVTGLCYKELKEIYEEKGKKILRLDEALEIVKGTRVKLVLDLKHGWMEKELIRYLVNRRGLAKIYRFDSHYMGVLATVKRLCPQAKTGISFPRQIGGTMRYVVTFPVLAPVLVVFKHTYPWYVRWVAGVSQADTIVINFRLVSSRLVSTCHEAGLSVCVFPPSMKRHLRKMVELGVDGITTNDMQVAREVVAELSFGGEEG